MKLISWNVNGLRACMGKNFMEDFQKLDADIFCLQETKLQEGQIALDLPGSKEESILKFYRSAGYNSSDKTAFIQWLE